MNTKIVSTRLSLVAAAAALALLAGCNRAEDGETVGQKVDQGIATAEQKTESAMAKAEQRTDQAMASAEQKGAEVSAAVEQKAEQAGNAIERGAEKAGDATADAALTAKVKTALMTAPDLKSLKIDVDTKSGVVTLNGEVKSSAEKTQAEQVAVKVAGVQSVINDLRIAG